MQNNTENLSLVPASDCPYCGVGQPMRLVKPDGCPHPGDFIVCRFCYEPLTFDEQMLRRQFPAIAIQIARVRLMFTQPVALA